MKLTLEHLAPYLPYGLKFYVFDDPSFEKKYLEKYPNGNSRVVITIDNLKDKVFKDGYKPILRPLSDLTKEIEHNGEKVNVQYLIDEIRLGVETYEYIDSNYDIELNIETADYSQSIDLFEGYRMVEILLKYHFDVFGLINKGLAIDINTLEK